MQFQSVCKIKVITIKNYFDINVNTAFDNSNITL